MVKVAFRYKPELVAWIKATGAGCVWNKEEKVWEVPEDILDELKVKADEMNVELRIGGAPLGPAATGPRVPAPAKEAYSRQQTEKLGYVEWDYQQKSRPQYASNEGNQGAAQQGARTGQLREGEIRLRRSRDGRFMLININLIAFSSDVEDLISGSKDSVKFRVLPPRPPPQGNA